MLFFFLPVFPVFHREISSQDRLATTIADSVDLCRPCFAGSSSLWATARIALWLLRSGSYTSPLTYNRCSSTANFLATATTARPSRFFLRAQAHQIIPSMSRPANPYDNASCESFMKTLKREEIYANRYEDLGHMRVHIEDHRAVLQSAAAALGVGLPPSGRIRTAN